MPEAARILGIDLAAQAKRTYACTLEVSNGALRAELHPSCGDEELRALAEGCAKVAIDAPFGWPSPFVDALSKYRDRGSWPKQRSQWGPFRDSLCLRATDRIVMHGRRPLSVSADKLGITAMRCAGLLADLSGEAMIDRTGAGRFVEVYPAAALLRWGLSAESYKGPANQAGRKRLLGAIDVALPQLVLEAAARALCLRSDDALDALFAALIGQAAQLGLTDGPPPAAHPNAQTEGWIHLPLRGSLPFLAAQGAALAPRPKADLAAALRAQGLRLDRRGYAASFKQSLLPSFDATTRAAIRRDLRGKGGSELVARGRAKPKFQAAHSSAALAANTFGPFLGGYASLPFGGSVFEGSACLERCCPSGLGGTSPTLDFVIEGQPSVLAVESKLTETFVPRRAQFSARYDQLADSMHPSWRREYGCLREDPLRYRHLDAVQLIKHYLGLKREFASRPVVLGYLFWEPLDATLLAPCAIHRAELAEFSSRLDDPDLELRPLSCAELWDEWRAERNLSSHTEELRRRYAVSLSTPSAPSSRVEIVGRPFGADIRQDRPL